MSELSKLFNYLIRILFVCIFLEVCMIYAVTPGKKSPNLSEKTILSFDNSLYVQDTPENEFIADNHIENILQIQDEDMNKIQIDVAEQFIADNFVQYQYISLNPEVPEENIESIETDEETEDDKTSETLALNIEEKDEPAKNNTPKETAPVEKVQPVVQPVVVKKQETAPAENEPTILVHKVLSGDNLTTIAKLYKTSVSNILRMNQSLSRASVLKTGQKIKVSPKEGICHVVKRGESLWKISNDYGISCNKLITYNNLENDKLTVKQNILIPWSSSVARKMSIKRKTIAKANASKFLWPIHGKITSPYGNRIHPLYKRKIFHKGIDIASSIGTKVKTTMSGTIAYAGWLRGYGKIIVIKHDSGYSSRYAHLSKTLVKKGQRVSQGKIIGTSGRTGNVTGPHLHFEIRRYGLTKDPIRYLRG